MVTFMNSENPHEIPQAKHLSAHTLFVAIKQSSGTQVPVHLNLKIHVQYNIQGALYQTR